MTYGEMVTAEQGRKGNSLYRSAQIEANDELIRRIMTATTEQLEALSRHEHRLSLTDTEEIKRHSLIYLQACTNSGTTPSFSGLCRALGYSRVAIYNFLHQRPEHETSKWLSMVNDAISEALADAALHGAVHPIVSIFVLKSRAGWREDDPLSEFERNDSSNMDAESVDEIVEKYLPD